ncbi:MAG: pilus assembly protein PilM [bacterium]|nr:pilus assembly protein PilM [Candidatus Sumerlaeota bacterium]
MAANTVIEFTDIECRVLQAERAKGRMVLRALFSFAMEKNDDIAARIAERAQKLRDEVKTHKLKAQKVHLVIPKNYVMARTVTLPSSNDDELAGMARFEAERHIPFNAERHIVSHCVLTKQGVQGSQVMIAAVDGPIAQEYLDITLKAGLSVDSLGVSSLHLFNAFAWARPKECENEIFAIVNIGAASTDFVIASQGMVTFTRGTSLGLAKLSNDLAEAGLTTRVSAEDLTRIDALAPGKFFGDTTDTPSADPPLEETALGGAGPAPFALNETSMSGMPALGDSTQSSATSSFMQAVPGTPGANTSSGIFHSWLLQLLKETQRTYEFARREFGITHIDHVYVSGEGALIKHIGQFLKANLGVECAVFDPLTNFETPPKFETAVQTRGPAFAAASGALTSDSPRAIRVNLLPTEYLGKIERKRQQHSWIISGALSLAVLLLAYICVSDLFARQQEQLRNYIEKNRDMKSRVEDLEGKKTRWEIINRYVRDEHGALDIIEKISDFPHIPDRVTITRFEYKKEESVKVVGHAKSIADVNKMETALRATNFFENVTQDQGSNRPVRLPNRPDQVLEYSITATFPKRETRKPSAGQAAKNQTKGAENSGIE